MTTTIECDAVALDRDATAPPTPTGDGPTRRRFLGLALAGGAGATAVGIAGGSAAAAAAPAAPDATTGSRAHYEVFQPGRLGPLRLKNRLVRSAAYMNTGSWQRETEGEVTDEMMPISPPAVIPEWPASTCSVNVEPDRNIPQMKIGCASGVVASTLGCFRGNAAIS